MQKLQLTKKENFILSKKLLRKLSCNQLLSLLPKIVEKLMFENNVLKVVPKSETVDSYSVNHTNKSTVKNVLPNQNTVNNSCTSTIDTNDLNYDHTYEESLVQMKSTNICESLISSNMADEIMNKFQVYTNRLTSKCIKTLSQTNDSSIMASELECDNQTSSISLTNNNGDNIHHSQMIKTKKDHKNGHHQRGYVQELFQSISKIRNLNWHDRSDDLESKIDSSQTTLASEIKKSCILHDNSNFEEYDDPQNNYQVDRSRNDLTKQYFLADTNKLIMFQSKKMKWSSERNLDHKPTNDKSFNTVKSQPLMKLSAESSLLTNDHSVEVLVDTCEVAELSNEERRIEELSFNRTGLYHNSIESDIQRPKNSINSIQNLSQLITSNSNCSLTPTLDINQRGDVLKVETTKNFVKEKTQNTNINKVKKHQKHAVPNLLKTSEPIPSIVTSQELPKPKKCPNKTTLNVKKDYKPYRSILKGHNRTTRPRKPKSEIKIKNYGLATSKIIDGRFRHGWHCTYKECLTFNPLHRPTCCNCFNPRWCPPYRSNRDTICRNCGYINYKSRLYCKKCKYIFFKLKTVKISE